MEVLAKLTDNEYKDNGYDHTRHIVRAFILNENNEILMHHLFADDPFGHRDYLETVGGGVKEGETLEQALAREIKEEAGLEVVILKEIGIVEDFYNFIHRKNINYYYLCKKVKECDKALEDRECELIESTKWYSIDYLDKYYKETGTEPLARLVKNRESIPFNAIKSYL